MADEITIPAGTAASPQEPPSPPADAATAQEGQPEAAATPDAVPASAAQASGAEQPQKRADDEPTLLEGVKGDDKAKAENAPEGDAADKAKAEADAKTAEDAKAKAATDEKAKADAAAAEKAAEDAKAKEAAEKPALEPVEYKYELPETLKMDDALKADVHAAFDAFRADPANPQALIDIHNREMTRYAEFLSQEQHRIFSETRAGWRKQITDDPELGGANHDTVKMAIAQVRDNYASSAEPGSEQHEKDMQAFDDFLRITGAGDHPVLWRVLNNVAKDHADPREVGGDINPVPNAGRQGKRGLMYDHPRSPNNRRSS